MQKEQIKQKVFELSKKQEWNHLYNFDGVITRKPINSPGFNIEKWARLKPILEKVGIKGKTVLDVGCSDGYFSLEMSKMGAHVVGIDPDPIRIKKANLAKEVLDVRGVCFEKSKLEDGFGNYDVIVALGFLHRVPELYRSLEIIANHAKIVILEFKTLEDPRSIAEWKGGKTKSNKFNGLYFVPTIQCVKDIMSSWEFEVAIVEKDNTSSLRYRRTIMVLERK